MSTNERELDHARGDAGVREVPAPRQSGDPAAVGFDAGEMDENVGAAPAHHVGEGAGQHAGPNETGAGEINRPGGTEPPVGHPPDHAPGDSKGHTPRSFV